MTQTEYEILMWTIGSRVELFNILLLAVIFVWAVAHFLYTTCLRLWNYIGFKRDDKFWSELLPE